MLKTILLGLVLSVGIFAALPAFSSERWKGIVQMKHVISAQKRAGMKPAKIQCRNNPRFTHDLRPEFRIVWNKDDSKRSWKIEARSNDYIPIARKREGWTLRSGESYTLKKSGKYFGCWIFYR